MGRPIMAPPIGRMLRPGETITATITWQPWMLDPTGRRVRVPPGSYSIEGYALWDRSGTPLLRSPRLSIEIRPERSGAADHLQSREDRGQISAGTFPALLHVGLCYRGGAHSFADSSWRRSGLEAKRVPCACESSAVRGLAVDCPARQLSSRGERIPSLHLDRQDRSDCSPQSIPDLSDELV